MHSMHSSCSSNGNASSGATGSAKQVDDPPQRLHRLNTSQKGHPHASKAERSICCLDEETEALPEDHTSRRGVDNQVILSVYPHSIGNKLDDLHQFLHECAGDGAIGGVHLLPLYPSTGDSGFAPVTYQEVDSSFGTWDKVQVLASEYQLTLEYMVNHISPASPQFQDYIQNGEASRYRDMFVKWRDIWPGGKPSAEQLARIRTRKPAPPVLEVTLADGSKVPLWNTFSDQQIDIDVFSEEGWAFTEASLVSLCKNGGAKLIRLDAFGYATKKPGTGCFMEEPDVWTMLERIREVLKPFGVQLLCGVHECFKRNVELARHGFWVYDFALPMLLLHALRFKTAESLKHWLSICPRRQITTLDTHDGMGVVGHHSAAGCAFGPYLGLAPLVDVHEVEQCIVDLGGTVNYKHFYEPDMKKCDSDDTESGGCASCSIYSRKSLEAVQQYLQPDCMKGCYTSVQHQYNATYFSATKEDPQMYLLARAVQFFTPGVPMVYYVGLLAGRNDYELLEKGTIRDINRHSFSLEEAQSNAKRPVVQALLKLCRFRNYHPAFKGRVFIDDDTPPHLLRVCWYNGTKHLTVLRADFEAREFSISHTPYRTPSMVDESVEEAALQSELSRDMAQVLTPSTFSIDGMDLAERAEVRTEVASEMQGLGVDDPEELLMVGTSKLPAAAHIGGNGSSRASSGASSIGSSADSSSAAASQKLSSDTSSSSGSGTDGSGDGTDGVRSSPGKSDDSSEAAEVMNKGTEGGLLQLDLSFAWQLEDTPVDNVDQLLQEATGQ